MSQTEMGESLVELLSALGLFAFVWWIFRPQPEETYRPQGPMTEPEPEPAIQEETPTPTAIQTPAEVSPQTPEVVSTPQAGVSGYLGRNHNPFRKRRGHPENDGSYPPDSQGMPEEPEPAINEPGASADGADEPDIDPDDEGAE